jgi:hypothetical protein
VRSTSAALDDPKFEPTPASKPARELTGRGIEAGAASLMLLL